MRRRYPDAEAGNYDDLRLAGLAPSAEEEYYIWSQYQQEKGMGDYYSRPQLEKKRGTQKIGLLSAGVSPLRQQSFVLNQLQRIKQNSSMNSRKYFGGSQKRAMSSGRIRASAAPSDQDDLQVTNNSQKSIPIMVDGKLKRQERPKSAARAFPQRPFSGHHQIKARRLEVSKLGGGNNDSTPAL